MPTDENQLRDLCRQAMNESDADKLLRIFLELDRATRREQWTEGFREDVREHRQFGLEGQQGTK
jgi:hypothetical protein